MLVESERSEIQWSEPRDLSVEEAILAIQAGPHGRGGDYFHEEQPGITSVLFGDGRIAHLPAWTPRETLEALLTINEKAAPPDVDRVLASTGPAPAPKLRWDHILSLSVLGISYAVLLFRPIRRFGADALPPVA